MSQRRRKQPTIQSRHTNKTPRHTHKHHPKLRRRLATCRNPNRNQPPRDNNEIRNDERTTRTVTNDNEIWWRTRTVEWRQGDQPGTPKERRKRRWCGEQLSSHHQLVDLHRWRKIWNREEDTTERCLSFSERAGKKI